MSTANFKGFRAQDDNLWKTNRQVRIYSIHLVVAFYTIFLITFWYLLQKILRNLPPLNQKCNFLHKKIHFMLYKITKWGYFATLRVFLMQKKSQTS